MLGPSFLVMKDSNNEPVAAISRSGTSDGTAEERASPRSRLRSRLIAKGNNNKGIVHSVVLFVKRITAFLNSMTAF